MQKYDTSIRNFTYICNCIRGFVKIRSAFS